MNIRLYLKTKNNQEGYKDFDEDFKSLEDFQSWCLNKVDTVKSLMKNDKLVEFSARIPELLFSLKYTAYLDEEIRYYYSTEISDKEVKSEDAEIFFEQDFAFYLKRFKDAINRNSHDAFFAVIRQLIYTYSADDSEGIRCSSVADTNHNNWNCWLKGFFIDNYKKFDNICVSFYGQNSRTDFDESVGENNMILDSSKYFGIKSNRENKGFSFPLINVAVSVLFGVLK